MPEPMAPGKQAERHPALRPAARSLAMALLVDSAMLACRQTRAATPTTAASSASRSIAGKRKLRGEDPITRLVIEERVEAAYLDRHP